MTPRWEFEFYMGKKGLTLLFTPKSFQKPDINKQHLFVLYKLLKLHQTDCVSKPTTLVSDEEKRNPNKPKNGLLVIHLLNYLIILG